MFGLKEGKKATKIKVTVIKMQDKLKDITIPAGATVEECFKQACIPVDTADGRFVLRKIVFVGPKKTKTSSVKWTDKVKEPMNLLYMPKTKGGR